MSHKPRRIASLLWYSMDHGQAHRFLGGGQNMLIPTSKKKYHLHRNKVSFGNAKRLPWDFCPPLSTRPWPPTASCSRVEHPSRLIGHRSTAPKPSNSRDVVSNWLGLALSCCLHVALLLTPPTTTLPLSTCIQLTHIPSARATQ
jgi:hypothetical protein